MTFKQWRAYSSVNPQLPQHIDFIIRKSTFKPSAKQQLVLNR